MAIASVGPDGAMRFEGRRLRAALGRGGLATRKHEGDGSTPCGLLPLRRVLYRADRLLAPPRTTVMREPLSSLDGWCDDPRSSDYNRQVRLPHSDRHERLWRDDALYDVIGVLGWNDSPPERHAGSAIFLHVAAADWAPTDGCVALALQDLLDVLAAGLTAVEVRPG